MGYSTAIVGIVAGLIVPSCIIVIIFILITFKKELKLDLWLRRCCCRETHLMVKKRRAAENPYILDNRGFIGRFPAVMTDDVELATHADMAILRQSMRQSTLPRNQNNTTSANSGSPDNSPERSSGTSSSDDTVANPAEVPLRTKPRSFPHLELPRLREATPTDSVIVGSTETLDFMPVEIEYENLSRLSRESLFGSLAGVHRSSTKKTTVGSEDSIDVSPPDNDSETRECSSVDIDDSSNHNTDIRYSENDDCATESIEYCYETDIRRSVLVDRDIDLEYIDANDVKRIINSERARKSCSSNCGDDADSSDVENFDIQIDYIDTDGSQSLNEDDDLPSMENLYSNSDIIDMSVKRGQKRHTWIGASSTDAQNEDFYENGFLRKQRAVSQIYENVKL